MGESGGYKAHGYTVLTEPKKAKWNLAPVLLAAGAVAAVVAGYVGLRGSRAAAFETERDALSGIVQRFQAEADLARKSPRLVLGERISQLHLIRAEAATLDSKSRCIKRLLPQLTDAMDAEAAGLSEFLSSGDVGAVTRIQRGRQELIATGTAIDGCRADPLF